MSGVDAVPASSAAAAAAPSDAVRSEQLVTPWEVEGVDGRIDYDKLITDFGCTYVDAPLLTRFERALGDRPLHRFLRRGIFYSHRDFQFILDRFEKGLPFYLYTGRGPSSGALHLGHFVPFLFTKWLQDVFQVPLVVQITDDEKYLWRKMETLREARFFARENIKDIIAVGFDRRKTFIFQDTKYMGTMYDTVVCVERLVSVNQVRAIFGFEDKQPMGCFSYPAIQAAPSFSTAFPHIFETPEGWRDDDESLSALGSDGARAGAKKPKKKSASGPEGVPCLIPCAIDQDPFFRMTRDVAPRLNMHKCALLHAKFFPALQGAGGKMSASASDGTIYLSDTKKQIATKVNRHGFSGGQQTLPLHRLLGANTAIDVPLQYLAFFLEDDAELARIEREYAAGRLTTGEVKKVLIDCLCDVVGAFQESRARVSNDDVRAFARTDDWDVTSHMRIA